MRGHQFYTGFVWRAATAEGLSGCMATAGANPAPGVNFQCAVLRTKDAMRSRKLYGLFVIAVQLGRALNLNKTQFLGREANMDLHTLVGQWPTDHPIQPHDSWTLIDSSKLKTLMGCPRKFLYEYLLGWRSELPNLDLVTGQAVHLAMDYIIKHSPSDKSNEALLEEAYQLYHAHFQKHYGLFGGDDYPAKAPGNIRIALEKYIDRYRIDTFIPIDIEVPASAILDDAGLRTIIGRIDLLAHDKSTGRIIDVDHKTASRDTAAWAAAWVLDFSFGTYLHMLSCVFPAEQIQGVLINGIILREEPREEPVLNPDGSAQLYKVGPKKGQPKYTRRTGMGTTFNRVEVGYTPDRHAQWLLTANHYYAQLEEEMEFLSEASPDDALLDAFPLKPNYCTAYNKLCPYHAYCTGCVNPVAMAKRLGPLRPPIGLMIEHWNPLTHETTRITNPDLEGFDA